MDWNLRGCGRALPPTHLPARNEISFGAGANETPLTTENEPLAAIFFSRLFLSRHGDGTHTEPLFRLQPERWLEARLRSEIAELLPGYAGDLLYSQVPAALGWRPGTAGTC